MTLYGRRKKKDVIYAKWFWDGHVHHPFHTRVHVQK
jgi:hypothetical protein